MPDFDALRKSMIDQQIVDRGIREPRLLDAFMSIPRERFVSPELARAAYQDRPLPIGAEQTISQPHMVATMIEAAAIGSGDRVLEIGAGSGYAAAVLSKIAASVVAVERHRELVEFASARLRDLGIRNADIVEGDGTLGWPAAAPYDAILVSASGSHVPDQLISQLADGGRLVIPIGEPGRVQRLVKLVKLSDLRVERTDLGEVRFVPLIGEEGWRDA